MIKTICLAISAVFAFLGQPFAQVSSAQVPSEPTTVSYTVAENIENMPIDAVVFDACKFNQQDCCTSKIRLEKNIETTDTYHFVYDSLQHCLQHKFDQRLKIVMYINDAMTAIIENPKECVKACKDFIKQHPNGYAKIIFIFPGKTSKSYVAMEKVLNHCYIRHHRFNEALTDPCISLCLDDLNF